MPSDPSRRAPDAALKRVDEEMRHRELKLQAELIGLRPLVQYVVLRAISSIDEILTRVCPLDSRLQSRSSPESSGRTSSTAFCARARSFSVSIVFPEPPLYHPYTDVPTLQTACANAAPPSPPNPSPTPSSRTSCKSSPHTGVGTLKSCSSSST